MARRVLSGEPAPLGATWDGAGTNFAIFSEHATGVELCLFSRDGRTETERIPLREVTAFVWHAYLPGIRPGQLYGYRVHGPYAPREGHRFNPNKLLIDPCARALHGQVKFIRDGSAKFGCQRHRGNPHRLRFVGGGAHQKEGVAGVYRLAKLFHVILVMVTSRKYPAL